MTVAASNSLLPSARGTGSRLLPVYARADLTIVRGEGARVWDTESREYLDFGAGIAVVGIGHRHPAPLAAARAQLDRLWHASNLYRTEPAEELAGRLSDRFGGAKAFFCNSGAEAVEAALKYARKATGKAGVVAVEGGFHGRTLGALSATGQASKREAFAPLVPGVRFVPPNDVDALLDAVDDEVGLILLEPILGEGGVRPLEPGFVEAAAKASPLLCFDEVQTGVGRTGSFFAFEQLGVRPDLVTLAKGLANGLPIGALLVDDEIPDGFEPGDHGSTFGGNPVSCAAACAVVDTIDDELLGNVRELGIALGVGLASLPGVLAVRGRGLLLGAELDRTAAAVVEECRNLGLLVLTAGDSTLRLSPPLTISEADVSNALSALTAALDTTASAYVANLLHTMNRRERQAAILELVRQRALSTQAEVAAALRETGFDVVQTTVSRDIADLGLVKVRAPSGRLVYAPPGTSDTDRLRALGAALRRYVIELEAAGTLVVLTTPSGYANALAQAIDEARHPAIAGTVAGDNTIFVAARDGTPASALHDELAGYLLKGAA